ncbi:MAG: type II toxin-antitoxin system VapC family toxin [Lacipirellulaceae bacterium]
MVFVDSGAWFALYVVSDVDHLAATAWRAANPSAELVTTAYVVSETLTLMRARRQLQLAMTFGDDAMRGAIGQVSHLGETDFEAAWEVFRSFEDKEWSFVDCLSYVAIERSGIRTAFAFDHHFRQFGTVDVVPE